MDKTHHGPVNALFSMQLQELFQLHRLYPRNQPFFTVIDCYILAIQQVVTHKEYLRYSFSSVAIFGTVSEALAPWSQQQKAAKTASDSFSLSNSSLNLPFFVFLMYALYGHPRYSKFQQKYQQCAPCFQTIFPFLMTMLLLKFLTEQVFRSIFHKIVVNKLWTTHYGVAVTGTVSKGKVLKYSQYKNTCNRVVMKEIIFTYYEIAVTDVYYRVRFPEYLYKIAVNKLQTTRYEIAVTRTVSKGKALKHCQHNSTQNRDSL